MDKVLGIDLGTNSLGWAIIDEKKNKILGTGVKIFSAAADDIGNKSEKLHNAKRRETRQIRRQYFRRKLRKAKILEVLINNKMCPLTIKELNKWNKKVKGEVQKFPSSIEFNNWLKLNPYELRNKALSDKLSLVEFGRVLYNLAQRRGFYSSRKNNKEQGAIFKGKKESNIIGITDTKEYVEKHETFGKYLYSILRKDKEKYKDILDKNGKEIRPRGRYTLRDWYITEFNILWEKQAEQLGLNKIIVEVKKRIHIGKAKKSRHKLEYLKTNGIKHKVDGNICTIFNNINLKEYIGNEKGGILFFQRELRSQKNLLSICSFERKLIPVIKDGKEIKKEVGKKVCYISHPDFERYRAWKFAHTIEYGAGKKLDLKDIKIVADYILEKEKNFDFIEVKKKLDMVDEKFNYSDENKVPGSPFTSVVIFASPENYNNHEKLVDLWHTMHFYKDEEMLKNKLTKDYHITDDKKLKKLLELNMPEGYSSLSLKAINNILPFMEKGYMEHTAVLLGGIKNTFGNENWERLNENQINSIEDFIKNINKSKNDKNESKRDIIINFLNDSFDIPFKRANRLYNHSEDLLLPLKKSNKLDNIPNLRNPIVQQALNEMRSLVNILVDKYLDKDEKFSAIKVELARELKMNKEDRQNIFIENQKRERENNEACDVLDEFGLSHSRDNIHKYLLWKELKTENGLGICPYTGLSISSNDLFNKESRFQIEHIVPYSISLDDSLRNKTLCEATENKTKGQRTPYDFYKNNLEKWEAIKNRAYNILPYEKAKLFTKETQYNADDFISRQLNDTRYISKKASEILKTISDKVNVFPGALTANLRNKWGLNNLIKAPYKINKEVIKEVNAEKYYAEVNENNEIIKIYPIRNSKPISGKNELVVSGEIKNKCFYPDTDYLKYNNDKIEISDNLSDGKGWGKLKIKSQVKQIIKRRKDLPELNEEEIVIIGEIKNNYFISKFLKTKTKDLKNGTYYCKIKIDKGRKIIFYNDRKKIKSEKDIIRLTGYVKKGEFKSNDKDFYNEKIELNDGFYYVNIPYKVSFFEFIFMFKDAPEIKKNEIALGGIINDNIFTLFNDNNFILDVGKKHPLESYWIVLEKDGEINNILQKENPIPKAGDKKNKIIEGEIRENKYLNEFYFHTGKDRTDHRHHAIDALTISLCSIRDLQQLSKINANKEQKLRGEGGEHISFTEPWKGFFNDAKDSISSILISHKFSNPVTKKVIKTVVKNGKKYISKGLSARGQLHKETIYGKVGEYFNTRISIDKLETKKDIDKIVDDAIKEIINTRIRENGGFINDKIPAGTLFSKDKNTGEIKTNIYLPNKKGGEKVPVKKIRIKEVLSNARMLKPSLNINQYVNPRKNHHVIIYEKKDGTLAEQCIQFWDTVERNVKNEPIYKIPDDGKKIITVLEIDKMYLLDINKDVDIKNLSNEALSLHLFRVQKLSEGYYTFRYHLDSTTSKDGELNIQSFKKWEEINPIEVKITNDGRIEFLDKKS